MRSAAMATHPEKSLGAELLQRAAFSDERRGILRSQYDPSVDDWNLPLTI